MIKEKYQQEKIIFDNVIVNFGPQHPAAHGVLRLLLEMDYEQVINSDVHIGLLHRGTEKLMEYKTFMQGLPYMDRLDYVSMMAQEHTYSLAVERLLNIKVSLKVSLFRILFLEITRILNHLLAVTTHALDIGAITPFLWGFEEREKLMEFYERVSGARLHSAFIKPATFNYPLDLNLINDISIFLKQFSSRLDEIEELLTDNRIWKSRLCDVGIISKSFALSYSFSGPVLRSTALPWDLRKTRPYEAYNKLSFNIPLGIYGDCYDRYKQRVWEMRESIRICIQVLEKLNNLISDNDNSGKYSYNLSRYQLKTSMESVIIHFKNFSRGFIVPTGYCYVSTEAPKGEFGISIESTGNNLIERCKIRAPGFFHLAALPQIIR